MAVTVLRKGQIHVQRLTLVATVERRGADLAGFHMIAVGID
ncbi:hypothetical protein AB3X91_39170 [Paraburkholderia sp. BR14263]